MIPRLVVFDLDACCWFPEMYMLSAGSPFAKTKDPTIMTTCRGERVRLLGDVRDIWRELHDSDARVAVASRCDVPEWARELLKTYEVTEGLTMWNVAEHVEIYKGSKQRHFRALHEKTSIPFDKMLFFDDDPENIYDVSKLGVTCVLTPDGVTRAVFNKGLDQFNTGAGK